MKKPLIISPKEARRIALHHQGLGTTHPFGQGRQAVLNLLTQLGYVQIDTISVVQRAHHHVLWSRIPGYRIGTLDHLQEVERTIFEYWAHAAAYLPMLDYRFAVPIMEYYRSGADPWPKSDEALKQRVLDRVRTEGPLMSRDFARADHPKGDGWWDWKPAKLALQRLFFEGRLMVRNRQAFQRVYDLTERVLPPEVDTTPPTETEYADYLIRQTLRAHGLATGPQMAYQRRGMGAVVARRLETLIEAGEVLRVQIGRRNPLHYFALPSALEASVRIQNRMRILSPFDNSVIQRDRLRDLWGFDYQIECYVPEPKRKYGYFCLPLLYGDQFVGRMDAKADRKTRVMVVRHLVVEGDLDRALFMSEWRKAMEGFLAFNDCSEYVIERTTPASLANRKM